MGIEYDAADCLMRIGELEHTIEDYEDRIKAIETQLTGDKKAVE